VCVCVKTSLKRHVILSGVSPSPSWLTANEEDNETVVDVPAGDDDCRIPSGLTSAMSGAPKHMVCLKIVYY
jgi:hypothetical protein